MNLLSALEGWISTALSYLSPHPKAGSFPMDMTQQVYSILRANARSFGPSPVTGGQIHIPSEDMSMKMAVALCRYAPLFNVPVLLAVAILIGESLGDNAAINPNWQDAKPHETAWMTFLHTDIGGAQLDGATLAANPYFAGKTIEQIEAIAEDPEWSMDYFCKFVHNLLNTMDKYVYGEPQPGSTVSDPTWIIPPQPEILSVVPGNNFLVFGMTGYNKGPTGTLRIASVLLHGTDDEKAALGKDPFSYGEGVVSRYQSYTALVGGVTSA